MKELALFIADISIRQDAEGRFCLNDLHKAAGNNPSQRPTNWLRTQQIQDLINVQTPNMSFENKSMNLQSSNMSVENRSTNIQSGNSRIEPIVIRKGGKPPGVYAIKKLVFAYATWISPEFHDHVLSIYESIVTKAKTPEQIYRDLANELRLALPDLRITDRAVLLSNNTGIRNLSGETREQCRYFRKMDDYGLPGIIVMEKKPYKVWFEWLTQQRDWSDEITDPVYEALRGRCAGYKGMLHIGYRKKLPAFQIKSCFEEITGIKSLEEAKILAADLAKIVADKLTPRTNILLTHQTG